MLRDLQTMVRVFASSIPGCQASPGASGRGCYALIMKVIRRIYLHARR